MLSYKIVTKLENEPASFVYFSDSLRGVQGAPAYDVSTEFDEECLYNKTIEVSTKPSNLYYIIWKADSIYVSHLYMASCVGTLAKCLFDALNSSDLPDIIYASALSDGKYSLIATDEFSASAPPTLSPIGPILNDTALVDDLNKFIRLLQEINRGNYPLAGYSYVGSRGELQPWYPYGGIKGHKRKLLEEGVPFLDTYRADVEYMKKMNKWCIPY